jgi:hypothetical protein
MSVLSRETNLFANGHLVPFEQSNFVYVARIKWHGKRSEDPLKIFVKMLTHMHNYLGHFGEHICKGLEERSKAMFYVGVGP